MTTTRTELNEREMMMANGGSDISETPGKATCYNNGIHYNCGGHISGQWNPFTSCTCDKCGETHYLYDSFFDFEDDYEEF